MTSYLLPSLPETLSRRRIITRSRLDFICAALLLVLPDAGAQAQDNAAAVAGTPATAPLPRPIHIGDQLTSEINPNDPIASGRHYEDFRLTLSRGASVRIDMTSSQIDSYLEIFRSDGTTPLDYNDDVGGGSLDSRLFFSAPDAGDYIIRAQQFAPGEDGRYNLSVSELPPPPPPRPIAGPIQDTLGPTAPIFYDRQRRASFRYQPFSFSAEAGDRVEVDMTSNELDSYLQVSAETGEIIASDDDSGENLNARIIMIIPRSGNYIIRASVHPDQSGRYTINVMRHRSPVEGPPLPITRGTWIEGSLTLDSALRIGPNGRPGYFYASYIVPVTGGEALTIEFRSNAFIPVVEAGGMSPLGFGAAQTSFDPRRPFPPSTRNGRVATLVLHPQSNGVVSLRVRSQNLDLGRYGLRVTTGDNAPPNTP